MWTFCLITAILFLILSVVFACVRMKKYKTGALFDPLRILFAGVIVSSVILFLPIYFSTRDEGGYGVWESVLLSLHNVIRLFVVDADFESITAVLENVSVRGGYTAVFSILFLAAPFLTFGFVLTFFKNVSAYRRYFEHFFSDVFVFSELNEKSLALAKSLHDNSGKRRFFVFTDVFERDEESSFELLEKVMEIGAVCFKKDVVTVHFSWHSKKKQLNFFAIGDDQTENVNQALSLIKKYKNRENTQLFVFSSQLEAEMLLSSAFQDAGGEIKMKVRRINEVQSLIFRNLYENGFNSIFQNACDHPDGIKRINAVVVGMGGYGKEMTKALTWFCQMDGYLAEIHSFDADELAEQRFRAECPELMEFSGKLDIEGESRYTVCIHSGVHPSSDDFYQTVRRLPQTTYVFVALDNDEMNIATAVKLRETFERMRIDPVIQAILVNSDKKEALQGVTNFKGQEYRIDFIGDIHSSYSENVILGSDVEEVAKERHLKWGSETEFWRYNYNYKSSVASAIHRKMKTLCGIPGIEKAPKDREENELWNLRILEHRRWNAYMRSEGYVYGGTVEKCGRNDLAKMHNCLVPFDQLPLKEQEKDDD